MNRIIKDILYLTESIQTFQQSPKFILVEDEFAIRAYWIRVALHKGLALAVYESPESFLTDLDLFSTHSIFCFDQDFGERRNVGVALARKVKAKFSAFVCLITNYPQETFQYELKQGILNQVCGKYPSPFSLEELHAHEQVGILR